MQHSLLQSVYEQIDKKTIKLLSLDIFDTLLYRRFCLNPTDVFYYQHNLLIEREQLDPCINANEWRKLRIAAEVKARELSDNSCREVSLKDIYSQLPLSIIRDDLLALMLTEVETEKSLVEVDPYIAQLINYAAEKGISYICVSDNYLNAGQILDLLRAAYRKLSVVNYPSSAGNNRGFSGLQELSKQARQDKRFLEPQQIFVSADYKKTKKVDLFTQVLEQCAFRPEEIVHLGDNPDADIDGAKAHKLQAIFYRANTNWQAEIEELEQRINPYPASAFAGLAHHLRRKIANFYDDDQAIPNYSNYAAFVYGPIFYGFANWCLQKAKDNQIKTIYCFTRESNLLVPVFNQLAHHFNIKIQSLAVSRQWMSLMAITAVNLSSLLSLFHAVKTVSSNEFLTVLGLDERYNQYLTKDQIIPADEIPKFLTILLADKDYFDAIRTYIAEQKKFYNLYLESINFFSEAKVAVCDLGWNGTIQKLLAQFLTNEQRDIHLTGLYLATTKEAIPVFSNKDKIYSYIFSLGEPSELASRFFRSPELIEIITMPAYGSLKRFKHIQPLYSERLVDLVQTKQQKAIQQGVLAFAEEATHQFQVNLLDDCEAEKEFIKTVLLRTVIAPTRFELSLFQHWQHEFNRGTNKTMPLMVEANSQPVHNRAISEHITQLSAQKNYWLAGALFKLGGESLRDVFALLQLQKISNTSLGRLFLKETSHKKTRHGNLIHQFLKYRERIGLKKAIKLCRKSYFFDKEWYLAQNPDVLAGGWDPILHYLKYGAAEGRDPSLYFSTLAYLKDNPLVAKKGINPLIHFEKLNRKIKKEKNPYSAWIKVYDSISDFDRLTMRSNLNHYPYQPLISIIMPVYNTEAKWLIKAIESVLRQLYGNWELCIADDASTQPQVKSILNSYAQQDSRIKIVFRSHNGHIAQASNSALTLAKGEFVAFLDHDDELAEQALYRVVKELNEYPDSALIYSDEDRINAQGFRCHPYFKSDWNPDLLYGHNFVCHLAVYRRSILSKIDGFRTGYEGSQDYDLLLRALDWIRPEQIRHIHEILYHWRIVDDSVSTHPSTKPQALASARKAIRDHWANKNELVEVVAHPQLPDYHRVIHSLPQVLPLVSIIIPTKDKLDLLKRCVDSLLAKTNYSAYEILIVDNQSREEVTKNYFREIEQPKVRVLSYPHPFNYSAINNFAVRQAKGSILTFLNNDTEIISANWLGEMVAHALRAEIGIVGAKLYYPDDSIQHAGVIGGFGSVAGHIYCRSPKNTLGQAGKSKLTQNFLAVTAACMTMRREVFEELNGFEEYLVVAFNDVDLCLRAHTKGYRILWTPHAELYHYESATRGLPRSEAAKIQAQKEIEFMQKKWGSLLQNDPFHNINLSIERPDCSLAFPPRKGKETLRPYKSFTLV